MPKNQWVTSANDNEFAPSTAVRRSWREARPDVGGKQAASCFRLLYLVSTFLLLLPHPPTQRLTLNHETAALLRTF